MRLIPFGFTLTLALTLLVSCASHESAGATDEMPRLVGGPCEGCEAVLEFGDAELSDVDTLPFYAQDSPKIKVSGTVYAADGETPAEGVVLYVYHTDSAGVYAPVEGATGWAARHGARRGWLRTGADGRYAFFTARPGSYPGRNVAAHIHPTILEPDGKYYYVEDYYFADDPYLTAGEKAPSSPRGGTAGVLHLQPQNGLLTAERDFVLSANVYDPD